MLKQKRGLRALVCALACVVVLTSGALPVFAASEAPVTEATEEALVTETTQETVIAEDAEETLVTDAAQPAEVEVVDQVEESFALVAPEDALLLDVDFSTRAAVDLSTKAHAVNGGNNGIIAYDEGLNKYVANFTGASSNAFIVPWSNDDYANTTTQITIESVFKAQPYTANYQDFFGNMQSAGIGFEISKTSSMSQTKGDMEVYIRKYNNGVSGTSSYVSPSKAAGGTGCFNFGEWTHAAITYDGANVKLYINGAQVASWAMTGPIVQPSGSARSFVIGGDITSGGGVEAPLQNGSMSTARIYSRALTEDEIAAIAARDLAPRAKVNATGITVVGANGASAITAKGGSLALSANVLPLAADNRFVWSIESGAEYADLDAQGTLRAKANGNVIVRATAYDGSGAFGEKTIAISGQDAQPSGGAVRFGVISDTHVTATKTVQQQRLAKAFTFFSGNDPKNPIAPVDKMVVVGDLTDNGTSSEMNTWGSIKNANLSVPLQAGMGNHENNRWAEFEGATGNQANYVTKLNGYTFITVSPGSGSINPTTGRATGNGTGSYAYAVSWLEARLAEAEAESPDKPIFVFFHHPIRGTFYVSNEWNGSGFENVFKTHPRAVTFAGHIHSPNNISTSIWQDGGYTAINTVSTSYFELERGMIYGSVPPNASQCAQGLLVEVDGSSVTVKNYDILADQWIDQTWTFDVGPDTRNMPYTNANLSTKAVNPAFPESAAITVSNQKQRASNASEVTATFTFDQAKIPATHDETMGDIVHSYRYDFYTGGKLDKSFTSWSDWYIIPMPEKYTLDMTVENEQGVYLKAGTDYQLRITAIDAFGKESATPLMTNFTTVGAYTERPQTAMNFSLKFDGNLNNANIYPSYAYMVQNVDAGIDSKATYEDGVNGKAIHLTPNNFVQLENTTNQAIDYNQSFTMAYWVNFKDWKGGDPGVISNKDWGSGGNNGFLYNVKDGRLKLNWTPVAGERHDSFADPNGQTAKNTWMHIAATFDKASDTVTLYYNGAVIETIANARLSKGIAGDNNATLLGNSDNTSGSYPRPYYNKVGSAYEVDMLLDDFVLVNDVYTADQIAALATPGTDVKRSLIKLSGAFQETIYKDEPLNLPTIQAVVGDARLLASLSMGEYELFSTPDMVDELDLNALITDEIKQALIPGDYTITLKAVSSLSKLLVLETKTITVRVEETRQSPPPTDKIARVTFEGPATVAEGNQADYTLGLGNVKGVATVKVNFDYSAGLDAIGATSIDDRFSILDARAADGKAQVILAVNGRDVDLTDAIGILKVSFLAGEIGAQSVKLTDIEVWSNEVVDGKPIQILNETDLAAGGVSVETDVEKYYDPYDFNRDGKVDGGDLAFAQYYYLTAEGDADWAIVSERGLDVVPNGMIDLADLIDIAKHVYGL